MFTVTQISDKTSAVSADDKVQWEDEAREYSGNTLKYPVGYPPDGPLANTHKRVLRLLAALKVADAERDVLVAEATARAVGVQ